MSNRAAIAIACFSVSLGFSCADDESTQNNEANNTTNVGATCLPGEFEATEVFDNEGALPFSYEIPAGFGSIDSSTDGAVAGSTYNVGANAQQGEFLNHFNILRASSSAEAAAIAEDGWRNSGASEIAVTFGGSSVTGFETPYDDRTLVSMHLPIESELYQVSLQWHGPIGCTTQWRLIRDHALETLAPNPDATFP